MSATKPILLDAESMLTIDLGGVKLIEASAGAGKTYTIANLYLRQILAGRSPAQILVVTFTNAATEELRGRIRARLFETLQLFANPRPSEDLFLNRLLENWQSQAPEQRALLSTRLQLALRCMDEARISTIHSFCQRALQDHALRSNQYFDANLITNDQMLWEQALKDWWREQSYALDKAAWSLFQSSLNNIQQLINQQKEIRDSHALKWMPQTQQAFSDLYQHWQDLATEIASLATWWRKDRAIFIGILRDSKVLSRAKSNKAPYQNDRLDDFISQIDRWFDSDELVAIPDQARYLSSAELHKASTPAKRGQDEDLNHAFFIEIERLFIRVDQIKMDFRAVAMKSAFDYSTQKVKQQKTASRMLSYDDQLVLLLEALTAAQGEKLAAALRRYFPVAMIDEFQDTDAAQYEIFARLYFSQPGLSLTMIGDPKQAIYSFRGGDIFTYMKARSAPGVTLCSLQTNWRSQADLVAAVNSFFLNRAEPFIYSDTITFSAALAAPGATAQALSLNGKPATAVTVWHIALNENNKPFKKSLISEQINQATADEIARLIMAGQNGSAAIGGQPLRSGDIAILVRKASEGEALRQVLADRGIQSVTIGKDRIFDCEEAHALYDLIHAISHYTDRQSLRRALASGLLNNSYQQIATIVDDEASWLQWVEQFRSLHQIWLDKGFIVMFQQCLHALEISQRLAGAVNAERRLTNLLHLVEILQQQSRISAGIDNLLAWFQKQIMAADSDETELRLESDAALVKIVTIHKSKGLEYPLVFLPFLWSCRGGRYKPGDLIRFHDEQLEVVIDIGSDNRERHACIAGKERLAEDLRLLYVALTRARSKIYLAWGDVAGDAVSGRPAQSALAYLLHSKQTPADLTSQQPNAFSDPSVIAADLAALAAKSAGGIEVVALPESQGYRVDESDNKQYALLKPASYSAPKINAWRIGSFSGLTRNVHQVAHGGAARAGDDAILNFPAGSHTGLLIHHLLESLDFCSGIAAQCELLIPQFAPRFGLDSSAYHQTLAAWLEQIVATEFGDGLALSKLSHRARLNELAFDFAVDDADINQLNRLLLEICGNSAAGLTVEPITASGFRGLVTGIIDLVFEFNGRYYIADYKSNHLGNCLHDYLPGPLTQAIFHRRYDLQYLIYTIALHRYLAQRLPDYHYNTHFGGVYYLFLRALRPQLGASHGVFFTRPDYRHIGALESLLSPSRCGSLA